MAGHIQNGGGRCSGLWRGGEAHEWSEGENQLPLQSERLPVIVFQAPFSYFNCLFYLENWLFLFRKSQIFWHFLFSQKILKFSNKSSKITKTNNLNSKSKLLSAKSQKNKCHLSKQIEQSYQKTKYLSIYKNRCYIDHSSTRNTRDSDRHAYKTHALFVKMSVFNLKHSWKHAPKCSITVEDAKTQK